MDPKVLVVDDDPLVLDSFKRIFGNRYQVACATDGRSGLALLEQEGPFDVVISDWKMPGFDGTQFLSEVRKRAPGASRIMLTGHNVPTLARDAVENGYLFDFQNKPFDIKALHQSIEAAVLASGDAAGGSNDSTERSPA